VNDLPTPTPVPDKGLALHLLKQRFPGTPLWFGPFTGHWWALEGDRFIEAASPEELGRLLDGLRALQPRTSDLPPARRPAGPETGAAAVPRPATRRGRRAAPPADATTAAAW
jgi:hypothetical protein